jgi:type IV secretory pathway VirB4 component
LLQGFVSSPFERHFSSDEAQPRNADKSLVIYDLFGMDALPLSVQNALVYLVCGRVRDLAFDQADARMKTIVLDEVAQLIRQPSMLGLFQELYCTARGYNTSVWTVTRPCKSTARPGSFSAMPATRSR